MWLLNPKNHCSENTAPSLPQSCEVVSAALDVSLSPAQRSWQHWKSPANMRRGLTCPKFRLFNESNLVVSSMPLHNCRCFQEHLGMLLQSLRALCLALGGPVSIWKYSGALVRTTGVSGRFVCDFRTDLHFADATWHVVYHIHLGYSHKIRYIILWHVLTI